MHKIQDQGVNIKPIAGCELTVRDQWGNPGHLLVAKPGDSIDQGFYNFLLDMYQKKSYPDLLNTINIVVRDHGGFAVVTHPALALIHSVSLDAIVDLAYILDPDVKKYVGLEVANWVSQVVEPFGSEREMFVTQLASQLEFPPFGGEVISTEKTR